MKPLLGIFVDIENVPLLADAGYDFWEGYLPGVLNPDEDENWWREQKKKIEAAPLPLRACNCFIPQRFRLTGPETTQDAALAFAVKACRRADEIGQKYIVFGSDRARNAPEGFPIAQAEAQLVEFCKRLCDAIETLNVTIVLEPLCKAEANLVTHVADGIRVCNAVGSERLKLLADIYHMLQNRDEGPEHLRAAGCLLRHVHVATYPRRAYPGYEPTDFASFFSVLRELGYEEGISCESWSWKEAASLQEAYRLTRETLLTSLKQKE